MRVTANQVTIARLCGLPFVGFAIYGDLRLRIIGIIVGTLIGLTDFVDGYLARKYGETVLGSLLDPVADKVFIVVCYACFADLGSMPWWVAAAVLSRELLVTVLRSSLELRGRRLPSTVVAKAKTWVQMIGFGLYALVPMVSDGGGGNGGPGLLLLFAVPLAVALGVVGLALSLGRKGLAQAFLFAAAVLVLFLGGATQGPAVAKLVVAGFIIAMTWYSALDYLALGFRELARPGQHRGLHWARLVAGGALPVVALVAITTSRLPALPLILLLSFDMGRGALDNYAANQRVVDFSWAASLWAEVGLLVAALAVPAAGTVLTVLAALIGISETLRNLARFLRGWAAASRPAVSRSASRASAEP